MSPTPYGSEIRMSRNGSTGLYSTHASSQGLPEPLQLYSTLQHSTALQLYSALQSTSSTTPLWRVVHFWAQTLPVEYFLQYPHPYAASPSKALVVLRSLSSVSRPWRRRRAVAASGQVRHIVAGSTNPRSRSAGAHHTHCAAAGWDHHRSHRAVEVLYLVPTIGLSISMPRP